MTQVIYIDIHMSAILTCREIGYRLCTVILRGVARMNDTDERRLYQLLGQRLKQIRLSRQPKLSQAELAFRLHVERTSITNLESGTQRAPLHLIYRLCAELSVEPRDLFPTLDDVIDKQMPIGDRTESVPPKTASLIDRLRNER